MKQDRVSFEMKQETAREAWSKKQRQAVELFSYPIETLPL